MVTTRHRSLTMKDRRRSVLITQALAAASSAPISSTVSTMSSHKNTTGWLNLAAQRLPLQTPCNCEANSPRGSSTARGGGCGEDGGSHGGGRGEDGGSRGGGRDGSGALGANVHVNEVVCIDAAPLNVEELEPEPKDIIAVVMRLSEFEAEAHHREKEHILERFGPAQTEEEEAPQLAVVSRCSDPYAYLGDLNSEEEEEEEEPEESEDDNDD